ncbi:MAG: AbrB/MazE/SpoVT family DNA-binding domain-containing protein [Candidatus Brocadiia bacterium]|nr:AbrB/MazE/SpoVT family DNA-binding domain-containing protein [Planctomycetota bacterium]
MKITSKGQVTIPIDIREKAGLLPETEVEFRMEDGKVILTKRDGNSRGRKLVERLKGKGSVSMTTDEIMALTRGEE